MSHSHPIPEHHMRGGYAALRRCRVSESGRIYLLTTVTVRRQAVFAIPLAAACAAACFGNGRLLGANRILAWVLMPDHAHLLLELGAGEDLSSGVSRLKSASSRMVNARIARSGRLWEKGYHDHAIRDDESLEVVAEYIIHNPVRGGLVVSKEDYPYWGSVWHEGRG